MSRTPDARSRIEDKILSLRSTAPKSFVHFSSFELKNVFLDQNISFFFLSHHRLAEFPLSNKLSVKYNFSSTEFPLRIFTDDLAGL